jgi:hypothetical protein
MGILVRRGRAVAGELSEELCMQPSVPYRPSGFEGAQQKYQEKPPNKFHSCD